MQRDNDKWGYEIPYLHIKIRIILVLLTITCGLGAFYYLLTAFSVKHVHVEGNTHYSPKEIQDMVMNGYFGDNSLYLSWKYRNKSIKDIPFIEVMDVKVESRDTIKISVYEKALAGYVDYFSRYVYFDHDGIVVEISKTATKGIPEVCGLKFDHAVLYQVLPVEDDSIFQNILTITKLLNKYQVECDKIYFDRDYNVTLYYGNIKVYIGKMDYLDEKLMQLPLILPDIAGQKGVLNLQNYSSQNTAITFEKE